MRRLAVLFVCVPALAGAASVPAARASVSCPEPRPAAASPGLNAALRAGVDIWGNRLLAAPGGPTYDAARRFIGPLRLARAAGQEPLTDSGAYYLPFGVPSGARGATAVALHLADGSELLARRVGGASLAVSVGEAGTERYGSCRARLADPRLADGWLPILQTRYTDAGGVRYRQESFTTRSGKARKLTSFVRVTADARGERSGGKVRLQSPRGLLAEPVPPGRTATLYAAWLLGASRPVAIDEQSYAAARESVGAYWTRRLAEGMTVEVPERRVADAARALRVQALLLTWRYSIGNPYEQFSFPEGVDVAQVLGEQGFESVADAIMRTSLTRPETPYPNWKMGEKLLGFATTFRLFRDRAALAHATPALRRYVATLGRQIDSGPRLLVRERYSSDIHDSVYGLHSQTVVWAGLRGMASAWAQTGNADLAATCRRLAVKLEAGLRKAVRLSQRRLPDGSLFVPVRLLDDEPAYNSLVEARSGSYWNLVMPYALASGFFAPDGAQADGIWRYMQLHGSRLLGLVRAGAYALYGHDAPFPVSGTDEVYGINVARFLADSGRADQLVLSLYGQLAAAMTPGTFVAGEAASVWPLAGQGARGMYLPPNGAANAAFLETLRLLLVHETPTGLELAYSTPRGWLTAGKRIVVTNAPTGFGPVSFAIEAHVRSADVTVSVPTRAAPRALHVRLRLPAGKRLASATLGGRPYRRFDANTGTLDLSGLHGTLRLRVRIHQRV